MKRFRNALLLTFFGWVLWLTADAVVDHERGPRIMFDPATDGPVLAQEKPRSAVLGPAGMACLTTMSIGGSSGTTAVYAPCSISTVGGGGGGSSR